MKRVYRILSVLLSVTLLLSMSAALAVNASDMEEGDYNYQELKNGTVKITKYTGSAIDLTTPSTLGGKKVTEIGNHAFYQSKTIEKLTVSSGVTKIGYTAFGFIETLSSVTLPDTLTEISDSAFDKCILLENFVLPKSLQKIGSQAFSGCRFITKIDIPDSVTEIGQRAFSGCEKLSEVKLSEGLTELQGSLFNECKKLKTITLPAGLKNINSAFNSCYGLESIIIPDGVTEIPGVAFDNCTALKDIQLSPYTKSIGYQAFGGCESLKEIELPEGLESIESHAFSSSGLTHITIPSSVKTIASSSFSSCDSLTKVEMRGINDSNESTEFSGNSVFAGDDNLKTIIIGSGVRKIDYLTSIPGLERIELGPNVNTIQSGAFYDDKNLREIVIPDNVKIIEDRSFSDSGLRAIYIGSGVKTIGENAFRNSDLSEIYYDGSEAEWNDLDKSGNDFSKCKITFNYPVNIDWETNAQLTKETLTLKKGESRRIEVTSGIVSSWSSDSSDVTVDKGTITGVKNGTATVTATMTGGKKLTCKVIVGDASSTPAETLPPETQSFTEPPETIPSSTQPSVEDPIPSATQPPTDSPETKPAKLPPTIKEPETKPINEGPVIESPETDPLPTDPSNINPEGKTDICEWELGGLTDAIYTGEPITQDVFAFDGNRRATIAVTYINNIEAGTAVVVAKGTGNYKGTLVGTFSISPAQQKPTFTLKTYSVSAKNLVSKNRTLKNVITVNNPFGEISMKKTGGSKYLTIKNNGNAVIKKAKYKRGTILKMKVKISAKADRNYTGFSKSVTVKVKIK